uniref:NADH dehydrogenase subunit 6 n=1 Tax=Platystethus dilutipennis TaxID=3078934 RepID=UPI002A80DBBD|nr:NADH dehydrogenase subunit 6 [Platystethus dilutipennis]WON66105.1 NADH dehydrogenase subunit 6 [Platystethus dilutipennis]
MLLILMTNFTIMFLLVKHPISMGVILLIQTLLTTMLMNSLIMNPWFSYIMLLVMIGGLLILFIYMTSLMANEKFKFNLYIMMMNLMMLPLMFYNKFDYLIILNIKNFYKFDWMLMSNFNKFFMFPSIIMMIIMILYLLMVLIAVVKISNFMAGPLRQKF